MIFIGSLASLALRIALAIPFFRSGLTKWDGPLDLSGSTVFLFENVYNLNMFGEVYPMPFPEIAAWAASFGEILLPAALVIGFATRLAALGTLGMTVVIFMVFPHTWANEQLPWSAMALALIAYGPGRASFDFLIARSFGRA